MINEEMVKQERPIIQKYLDIAGVIIVIINSEGNITLFNKKGSQITGYKEEEILGKNWFDTCVPLRLREEVKKVFRQIVNGEIASLEYFENSIITRNGEERIIAWHNSILRDEYNNITGTLSSGEDITDRKKYEEVINESQKKYSHLFENLCDAAFLADIKTGIIVETNRQGELLLGKGRGEIVGIHQSQLHPPELKEKYGNMFSHHIKSCHISDMEGEVIRKDGKIVPVTISSSIFSIGDHDFILGLFRDISERKKAEDKFKKAFTYNPLVMAISDIDTGKFLEVNKAFLNLLEYEKEEVIGKTSLELNIFENHLVRQKIIELSKNEGYAKDIEINIKTKNGNNIYGLFSTDIIDIVGRNYLLTAFQDITERKKMEDILREKTEELDRFFTVALDLLCIADMEGYFKLLNPSWEKTLGYSLNEIIGKKFIDFVHPEDVKSTIETMSELRNEKEILNFVNRYRCKDNTYKWLEWRSFPAGNMIYAAARDITERKKAEELLNEKIIALTQPVGDNKGLTFEDLFDLKEIQKVQDAFADATGVSSIIIDPEGTHLTKPSNFCRLCTMIRQSPEGQKRCQSSDSMMWKHNPSGYNIDICKSGKLWQAGASIMIGENHIASWIIGQVMDEDVEIEEMNSYAMEIGLDEKEYREALKEVRHMPKEQFEKVARGLYVIAGQLSLLALQNIQQARYISERKIVQEALKESEEKYRLLFKHMTNGFALHEIICNEKGEPVDYRYLEANPAFEKLTGLSVKELIGKTILEVIPDTEQYWIETFGKVALTGEPVVYENYFAHSKKYYEILAFSPKTYQFAVIFTDITERKEAEKLIKQQISQLEAKNAELERFTYTVSHDLKSPLITIKGFVGHLMTDAKSGREDRLESDIKRISNAADKMHDLLEDLLELSRIGRIINLSSEFSMSQVIKEASELLSGPLKEGKINFSYDKNMPSIYGDKLRIREVWQNLIENAIKYTGERNIPEIDIGYYNDNSGEIVFYIKDNGMGIEEKYYKKIFGLFEKLNPRSEGTGIGLALVKRIIELHGGQIWVKSEGKNKGTGFYFKIPKKGPEK